MFRIGLPHSSHSGGVNGRDESRIVFKTSTKGTSATADLKSWGAILSVAPIKSPPALPPWIVKSLDNLEFGAKFKILDKKETLTKISFLSHLSVSTEYSDNSGGLLNRILVSHELSESFELAYNLGYSKYFEQDNGLVVYSLVVAKSFGNLGAFVEIFGDSYSNWDLGITYLIKDNLQADISYGQGINNELSYLSIGAAWNFSLKSNK